MLSQTSKKELKKQNQKERERETFSAHLPHIMF